MAKKGSHLCVHLVFSFLLLLSGVLSLVAAIAPQWIYSNSEYTWGNNAAYSGNNEKHSCGVFSYCHPSGDLGCDILPHGDAPEDVPIVSWRVAGYFYVVALIIIWVAWVLSLLTCCFCYGWIKAQAPMLIAATLCLFAAMISFGYGLDKTRFDVASNKPNLHCACGAEADRFNAGSCELGYAAGFAITATVITCITSCVAYKLKRMDEEHGMLA